MQSKSGHGEDAESYDEDEEEDQTELHVRNDRHFTRVEVGLQEQQRSCEP